MVIKCMFGHHQYHSLQIPMMTWNFNPERSSSSRDWKWGLKVTYWQLCSGSSAYNVCRCNPIFSNDLHHQSFCILFILHIYISETLHPFHKRWRTFRSISHLFRFSNWAPFFAQQSVKCQDWTNSLNMPYFTFVFKFSWFTMKAELFHIGREGKLSSTLLLPLNLK